MSRSTSTTALTRFPNIRWVISASADGDGLANDPHALPVPAR
jgi:hypothetical protein